MTNGLKKGMTLYHANLDATCVTRARILEIRGNDLFLQLEKPVVGKTELRVPKNQMGRHLFFTEEDVAATLETLALRQEYRVYGNRKLEEVYQAFCRKVEVISNKAALLAMLMTNYGFQGFLHYTDISNFEKIMKEGYLYSRIRAEQDGRLAIDGANGSVLRNTCKEYKKYVRFFYRTKTPTLYANEGIKKDNGYPHMPVPVLLLFDEHILFEEKVTFLDGGGGSGLTKSTKCAREAQEFDWDSIFSNSSLSTKNHRNAEFHVYEKVGIDHLKKILFRSEPEMQLARHLCGDNELYEVDSSKFCCLNNYLTRLEVRGHDGIYIVSGDFNANPNGYSHELKITYENGVKEVCLPLVAYIPAWGRYFFDATNKRPCTVEYAMNGHRCGVWEAED